MGANFDDAVRRILATPNFPLLVKRRLVGVEVVSVLWSDEDGEVLAKDFSTKEYAIAFINRRFPLVAGKDVTLLNGLTY